MKVTLESGNFGWDYILEYENGYTEYIQSDWEYPVAASIFGYVPCSCGRTDGTVNCKHKTVDIMLTEAAMFLDEHIGETIEV